MLKRIRGRIKDAVQPFVRIETESYETAVANRFARIARVIDREQELIQQIVKGASTDATFAELSDTSLECLSERRSGLIAQRQLVLGSRTLELQLNNTTGAIPI